MDKTKQNSKAQHSISNVKVMLVGLFLIVAIFSSVWWLYNFDGRYITEKNSLTLHQPFIEAITEDTESVPLADEREELSSGQKQSQLYAELWSKLHNPDLRDTLTARQLLDTPGFETLSTEQMQRLVNETMALLDRSELDRAVFMDNISRKGDSLSLVLNEGVIESAAEQPEANSITTEPTPEQALAMDYVRQLLQDTETAETVTAAQLLKLPEVQILPAHLRQQLANEVVEMLSRGEINSKTFLATLQSDQSAVTLDEEARRATITHEQWQAFENLQAHMQAPDFETNTMLAQILTSQDYKILPAYLREQLSEDAAKMLENSNEK